MPEFIPHISHSYFHCRTCKAHLAPVEHDADGRTFIRYIFQARIYRAAVFCFQCGTESVFISAPPLDDIEGLAGLA